MDHGDVEPFPPHVMLYAPYLTNAELGADIGTDGNPTGAAFVAREGTRDAVIIVPSGRTQAQATPPPTSARAARSKGRRDGDTHRPSVRFEGA
jgi:hypothetical protein